MFGRRQVATAETLITGLQAFDDFSQKTITETPDDTPYLINEFWIAGQRQAHSIHDAAYRAFFKAQLAPLACSANGLPRLPSRRMWLVSFCARGFAYLSSDR